MTRKVSRQEYEDSKKTPVKSQAPSLLEPENLEQKMMRALLARMNHRPVRFDVEYDSLGKIKSVIPIYKDEP
jgi:hypothetical protein